MVVYAVNMNVLPGKGRVVACINVPHPPRISPEHSDKAYKNDEALRGIRAYC